MKLSVESSNVLRLSHRSLSATQDFASRTLSGLPSVIRRAADSSSTCTSDNTSAVCEKPESAGTGTLTIAVAAAVPTVVALVVLFFLHRRIRKRLRQEDANDKHAAIDFDLNDVPMSPPSRNGKKMPEMSVKGLEKSYGHDMSADMSNPYLLPASLHDSKESLHSMSRSLRDAEDPYRPITLAKLRNDSTYSAASRALQRDNASVLTGSTDRSNDAINANLLKNASRFSQSDPYQAYSPTKDNINNSQQISPRKPLPPPPAVTQYTEPAPTRTYDYNDGYEYAEQEFATDYQEEQQAFQITPPSPPQRRPVPELTMPPPAPSHVQQPAISDALDLQVTSPDLQRRQSTMGLRPLPMEDPADNPEQRANRIRSFYKEYFDDSKPNPAGHYPQYNPYDDVYEAEFYNEGAVYDPETGMFYNAGGPAPYAEPIARRAMTPPPAGSELRSGRVRSNTSFQSTGHINNPAFRRGPKPALQTKRRMPPPAALTSLPTPHKILYDSAFSPIDFAPRSTFRDRQLGRVADSPVGTARPYAPMVPVYNPLVRSFDDLNVMPSPHALRVSGTFTGLDFAPPPRFRNEGSQAGGSETGSIRSNRSGISAVQSEAIRNGAYRVSRIPKEMVGTKLEFATALKPQWDMRK